MLTRHVPMPIAHRAVVHGGTIYLAGMVADDKSLSIRGQTSQVLQKLDALLKTLNSDATRVLSTMVYITTMKDKDEMNAAWMEFFKPEDLPTRATVAVAQLGPGTLIEVVATAAVAGA